jgi:class 3 adenylate cyclase
VLDAVGSARTAIFAEFDGGPIGVLFAAMHPGRVSSLILSNTTARFLADDDYPAGAAPDAVDGIVDVIRQAWGTPLLAQVLYPDRIDDPQFGERFARFTRAVATPRTMAAQLRYMLELDAREALPMIGAPTLVLHNRGNILMPIEMGRYLADHIPGATFVEVAGDDSTSGTYPAAVDEVRAFLTGQRTGRSIDRVLTTILFTDICGSTEHAAALGDSRWRILLDAHDREIRNQIERFRGREVKTTGDGFLVSFDGPARSIRCAKAMIEATQELGIQLRVGIHTGECEVRGEDLAGMAVHIAARIGALAEPSQVLASGTVKDLVVGSDIEFESHGEQKLRGVPGIWKLFSITR